MCTSALPFAARVFTIGLLGLVLSACGGSSDEPPFDAATQGRLDAALREAMATHQVPAAVAGVWVPGRGTWVRARGLANVADGRPVAIDDHFGIRSVTKSFVVTVILQLAAEGRLSLDAPVVRWVSGIPNGDPITLRNLAGMTSGLVDYTADQEFIRMLLADPLRHYTERELVDVSARHLPKFEPGTQYDYCNANTVLLGMVAEAVEERPLGAILHERIFRRLRLASTSYPWTDPFPLPRALSYLLDPADGLERFDTSFTAFAGSGGMVATLADLRVWARALATGALLPSDLQAERMSTRPATSGPEYDGYGLGIGQLDGWWGHTGDGLGYQAAVFHDLESGGTIVVLVNLSLPGTHVAADLFRELASILRQPGLA